MPITSSTSNKVARAQASATLLGASATLKIYSGAQPADPNGAPTGTLLSTLTGNASGFGTVVPSGVNGVVVGSGGAGYASAPAVSFSGGGASAQASAVANIAGGIVTSISVTDPGAGYTSPPTVTLTGGGFTTAATATATTGVVTKAAAISQDNGAAASGTPGYCRIASSTGTAAYDLDISGAGAGGSMQLLPNTIVAGAPVSLSTVLINE